MLTAERCKLIEDHEPMARSFALMFWRAEEEGREILTSGEVLALALEGLVVAAGSFDGRRPFELWARVKMRGTIRDGRRVALRNQRRELLLGDEVVDYLAPAAPDTSALLVELEDAGEIRARLARLPQRYLRVLEDRLAGVTQDETAAELGVDRSRVAQLLGRAHAAVVDGRELTRREIAAAG